MSSVAYNLSRKLEWMARRIRRIDDAGEIKLWVEAMAAINCLLKVVEFKDYNDDWKPWRVERTKKLEEGWLKKDSKERLLKDNDTWQTAQDTRVPTAMDMEVQDAQTKKEQVLQMLMPPLKSPVSFKPKASSKPMRSRQKLMRGKMGTRWFGVKKDEVKWGARTPLTGKTMVANGVVINEEETNDDDPALTKDQVRQLWKYELHRRMKEKGLNCGLEWSGGLSREWNTGRSLLKSIAEKLNRDASKDLERKDLKLKTFLDNESNLFFKTGRYDKTRKVA